MGPIIRVTAVRPLAALAPAAVALVALVGVPTATLAAQPASETGIGSQTTSPSTQPAQSSKNATPKITVNSQVVAHRQVLFARVQTPQPAWLVLHPGNGHGKIDHSKTLAAVHVTAGVHTDVIVHISKDVAPGQPIYAALHQDSDGNKKYTYRQSHETQDKPMTVNGHAVISHFKVERSAKKAPHHVSASTAKPGQAGPSNTQGSKHKATQKGSGSSSGSNAGKKNSGSGNS